MHQFYFNECLPESTGLAEFTPLFSNSIREYHQLIQANIAVQKGIVTEKIPSELFFSNGDFSLKEVIERMSDKACKSLAYSYFTKYPIQLFFSTESELTLLEKEYQLTISEMRYDALNLALVASLGGLTFTVALHDDLKRNNLLIVARTEQNSLEIYNLFGEQNNTTFLQEELIQLNNASLSLFDQLIVLLNKPIYTAAFKRDFSKLNQTYQKAIIDRFRQAIERKFRSPLYPDTKIIKDVSPDNTKCSVYELRVYNPDLRVYFHESSENVFLSSIELKSNPDQNKDIIKASQNLYKLIATI